MAVRWIVHCPSPAHGITNPNTMAGGVWRMHRLAPCSIATGSRTSWDLSAARFLLKPGRKYAESVKLFEPYDKIKDPNPDARAVGAALIKEGVDSGGRGKTFIWVNNRQE